MMHLRTARVAMVALTAIGMIWTTTAHAAAYETGATNLYSTQPPGPTSPQYPTSPGPAVLVPADMKVTFVKSIKQDSVITYTFRVENAGLGTARQVLVRKSLNRFENPGAQETESTDEYWGDVAPGVAKNVVFSCAPKAGHPPCYQASVTAFLGNAYVNDADTTNNWALGY